MTQSSLEDFDAGDDRDGADDLDELTDAEREVFVAIETNDDVGPRQLARETDRSPGTIGNLLSRAREKLGADE